MEHTPLISFMRGHRGPEAATLDEYFEKTGPQAWGRLRDAARHDPNLVDDAVIEWASGRISECPGAFFALLLDIAAKDKKRREGMLALYRKLLPAHPGPALGAAGYNLHEFNRLLGPEWLAAAQEHFDHDPEGAWGIFESAAMYRPELVLDAHVDWFEARRAAMPRDYFVSMLSLASRRPTLLERVLRAFPEHPAQAVDAAAFAARDEAALLTPELVGLMLRHFDSAPDKAWEFFEGASRARPEIFEDSLLERLSDRAEPGTLFTILRRLIESSPDRAPSLLDRFAHRVRRHPEAGVKAAKYAFQGDGLRFVRPDLVRAVCEGFAADAYPAYELLGRLVNDRPELIGPDVVDAAIRNIGHATNYAFGFFRELLKLRPEFTRECTLALFECLALEPPHRAFVRAEQMDALVAISEAAHIRTGLENALREPPRVGSRRARALMAIMFRQKLRARRHVLLEALRAAAGIVLWHKAPGSAESEKYSPVWDFVMFIIDHSGDDAVSTAAAERFLEGAFQLHYLCRTGAEHDEFLLKLDIAFPPHHPFPEAARFLQADAELALLYDLVQELGRRFGAEPRLAPLTEFTSRLPTSEIELQAIAREASRAEGVRLERLRERKEALQRKVDCWRSPDYARAFDDPEIPLPDGARALLKREKKDLAKNLRDALRAEAVRIAVSAVDRSRLELYRNRLEDVLGREVDISRVEPRILPAFLWFPAIAHLPNNTKFLKRLIEDRITGRPHDWLRTEPAVLEWAEQVKKAQPGVRLDRWRAPFEKGFQYRPKDALAEKRRRIKADLAQARELLEKAGAEGVASESYEELAAKLIALRTAPAPKEEVKEARRPPDPALLEEIAMNLERVRIAEQTPDSDFEGKIVLTVETDPFEILFMGEYGFASCLSLRGSNAWSAVSNAIDLDKAIVWAREPGGNVVGRRLLALTPEGVLTFRSYTNRHGLALDRAFDEFVEAYAAHCGTRVTHGGHPGPLLSDRWYDDGAM